MIEEKIQKINTIHEEIDGGSYQSPYRVYSDKYSSNHVENIDYIVDRVIAQHSVSSYTKRVEKKYSTDRSWRYIGRRKIRSIMNNKNPVKEILAVALVLFVILAAIPYILPSLYGDFGSDISVSLIPENVYNNDTMFVNVTIPSSYRICSVTADMGSIETINLTLIDNSTLEHLWQSVWIVHDVEPGEYIVTITALDEENMSYYAGVGWSILPVDLPDDDQSSELESNVTIISAGLNLSLWTDRDVYFVNETILVQGTVSFNDSLINASADLFIVGSGVNLSVGLNVSDGRFSYLFIPAVVGDYTMQTMVSYENETVTEELLLSVQNLSLDNVSEVLVPDLCVWDDTDYQVMYVGDDVNFYANYSSCNQSIENATCLVSFNVGTWTSPVVMSFIDGLYVYNRSFSVDGIYGYRVWCSAPGFENRTMVSECVVSVMESGFFEPVSRIEVGSPVLWMQSFHAERNLTVNISGYAYNISVSGIVSEDDVFVIDSGVRMNLRVYNNHRIKQVLAMDIKRWLTRVKRDPDNVQSKQKLYQLYNELKGNISLDEILNETYESIEQYIPQFITDNVEIQLLIPDVFDDVVITFLTVGPVIEEYQIGRGKKRITVSSDVHYENILAHTELPMESPPQSVKLYHLISGGRQEVSIDKFDLNGNSLVDYIEWIVPSLSNQTYELVIEISKAVHLDENRTFVSDIYNETKVLDDIWSESIPSQHYVRVTFEKPLDNTGDITIYPRVIDGSPKIRVYEVGQDILIAEFTNLSSNQYNKVYLIDLQGSQDIFDLEILNGDVEFDHVFDPPGPVFTWTGSSDATSWADQGNWDIGDGTPGDDGYPDDADDKAVINSTSHSITTSGVMTIGALELNASFTGFLVLGGNLTLVDSGLQDGSLNVSAGSLNASGFVNVTGDMSLVNGTFRTAKDSNGNVTVAGTLLVDSNGIFIVRRSSTTGNGSGQTITAGTLSINGIMGADGEGFAAGQGPGTGVVADGGSHGGRGGDYQDNGVGSTYGSFTNPTSLGSGGYSGAASAGGGAINISVTGTLTVIGTISADGNSSGSGGSGGSINIIADTLTGSGTIRANGGSASTSSWGAGGGGRISFKGVTTDNFNGTLQVNGYKGAKYSYAGTIYFNQARRDNLVLGTDNITSLRFGTDDNNNYTFGNITIQNGATLEIDGNPFMNSPNGGAASFTLTSLDIQTGGTLKAVGLGFGPGLGPGSGTSADGGSHGGRGGDFNEDNTVGSTYGSMTNPPSLGSGGYSGASDASAGGGAINISVTGTVTVNGTLSADGNSSGSGGAGGSINIIADTLTGNGTIRANGGNASDSDWGAGGGGRISLNGVTTDNFNGTIQVHGGTGATLTRGYAGTIYFNQARRDNLVLGTDNITSLRFGTDDNNNYTFGNITIQNGATLEIDGNPYRNSPNGSAASLTVTSLDIQTRGTLKADGLGFGPGLGPGYGTSADGGSHGGRGGDFNDDDTVGSTYGSFTNPISLGSGGYSNYAAYGGGAINISATGTVTVNGTLSVNGNSSNSGGAGGSINIIADTLTGNGTIRANGGNASNSNWGAGGGGRISLNGVTTDNFNGTIQVNGGTGATRIRGYAGTIYFNQARRDNLVLGTDDITSLRLGSDDNNNYTFGNITIQNGATLEIDGNPSRNSPNGGAASLTVISIDIQTEGTLKADGFGFPRGVGPGTGTSADGGSYGGRGGDWNTDGGLGPTYGSFTYPTSLGSGGFDSDTSYGGGAINISATGTVIVNGTLSANGASSNSGGSGGSINIIADMLTGSGTIRANGGSASQYSSGGGGRIGFHITTTDSFNGTLQVNGGSTEIRGYAGTIYFDSTKSINLVLGTDNITSLRLGSDDNNNYTFGNITIQNGATLEIDGNPSRNSPNGGAASLTVISIDIQTEGTLKADGFGFAPGLGPGIGTSADGGSYGGHGGDWDGDEEVGSTYGSITKPTSLGSGGYDADASYGGGAINISATGAVTVNGTISANGNSSNSGGAGGSINIIADTLTGSGTIRANGGNASQYSSGGGGRVSVTLITGTSFGSIIFQAYGGSTCTKGAAGTIYMEAADDGSGDGELIINNNYVSVDTFTTTEISSSVTDTAVGNVTIQNSGHLEISNASVTLTVSGSWSNSSNQTLTNGTIVFDSTSSETIISGGGSFYNVTFNGSGGSWALQNDTSFDGALIVKNGVFDLNDQNLSINGNTTIDGGTLKIGTGIIIFGDAGGDSVTISSGELQIESDDTTNDIVKTAGSWTNSGGTITYNAGSIVDTKLRSAFSTYNNLTINSSGSTYSLDGAIDVDGNLTITAGTLDVTTSNYNINISGNWSNSDTFIPRGGTVIFNGGNQTITGSTTFYNFSKTETTDNSADVTLTFDNTATQTISGLLTFDGLDNSDRVNLVSDSDGVQWALTATGTFAIDYVDVKDSDASGGNTIEHTYTVDSGNNINWGFEPLSSNESPLTGSINISLNPILSIQVNDTQGDLMTIQFWTNASGSWQQIGTENTSATNGTYTRIPTNMDSYSTLYYWSVNTTDPGGSGVWRNETYYFTTRPANYVPTIEVISPTNGTTNVSLQPTCQIWANDTDGDTLSVYWYENTTGSWILQQTNNSVSANSTLNCTFTQFSNYSITYYWKVAVNDSKDNISALYHFTTEPINTSIDTISPYYVTSPSLIINATAEHSDYTNVTLWYRYSSDNSSWGNWWSSSFSKRKAIKLNVSSGSTPSGYQVLLNITYDSDMNNNFSDLRFVNYSDNSTEFDYWIESKSDGNWANVWVEFGNSITTTNQTHAWVYYGNSSAGTNSNGTNTFELFDDFLGTTYDESTWGTNFASNMEVNSGTIALWGDWNTGGHYFATDNSYNSPIIAQAKAKITSLNSDMDLSFGFQNSQTTEWWDNNNNVWCLYDSNGGGSADRKEIKTDGVIDAGSEVTSINFETHIIEYIGIGVNWYDSNLGWLNTTRSTFTPFYFSIAGDTDSSSKVYIDYVFLRNYCSIEPNYFLGLEEENVGQWQIWDDISNPDASSPWGWSFDFPNGTGYYEFYSIGKKLGSSNEIAPSSADARCKFNRIPTITNEGPSNGSTDIQFTPKMNITVNDTDGDTMTITWYSNSSGSWQVFGINTSVGNGTYHQTNSNFSFSLTTYWWNVAVSDGFDTNSSAIYHFNTGSGPPTVITNASTGVEETNATLHGYLIDNGGEPCTVRFEYGITLSYGTNTSNQTKNIGDEFTKNIVGLTPGQLYHYRTYANNTFGLDTGDEMTLLTKPQPPTDLTAQTNNSNTIYLTWTNGTGVNNTYIERNTTASWTRGQATEVYNDSGVSYEDTDLSEGTTYYYQAWSYTNWTYGGTILQQWSDNNASTSNKTNNNPSIDIITPVNGSTGVSLQPTCSIWANDTDGDTLAVYWYENTTGGWVHRQTNGSISANSTVSWIFSQASSQNTQYWWKVAVNDSMDNITAIYYFTTGGNVPTIEVISPTNGTTNVSLQPTCQIWANDTDGDTLSVYWYENTTGSWILQQTNNSVSANSTLNCTFTQFSNYSITYYWKVAVNDSKDNISALYHFTTEPINTSVDTISPYYVTSPSLLINATAEHSDYTNVTLRYRYSSDNSSWVRADQNWWNTSFSSRKLLTINNSQVDGNLSNFPILVYRSSDSDLASRAQDDGDDIVFILYSDNTTQLNHEIELFNGTTGKIVSWVNITSLSSTTDTKIWMYYGNSTCSSQENIAGTWDSNYMMVQHLNEKSGTHYDSTSYGNNGSTVVGVTQDSAGKIDGGDDFDGSSSYIDITMNLPSTVTISAWAQKDTDSADMLWCIDSDDNGPDLFFGALGIGEIALNTWDSWSNPFCNVPADADEWHLYTTIIESGNTKLYIDDQLGGTANYRDPTGTDFHISSSAGYDWDGKIDEVLISNIVRNSSWINTSYNTMNNTDTFLSFSSEENHGWIIWNGTGNPDTGSPWQWSFDFPNRTGYYEFYSIGKKSGSIDETTPDSADAMCYWLENKTINVTPPQWNQGAVWIGTSNETTGFYFNITNEGNLALDILVKASNATNVSTGARWNLNLTPGYNNFSLQYNKSGGGSWTNINTTYDTFVTNLGINNGQTFDLKMTMATTSSTGDPMSFTITFKSVAS